MKSVLTLHLTFAFWPPPYYPLKTTSTSTCRFRVLRSANNQSESIGITEPDNSRPKYSPGIFDDLFLNLFRNRMVHVSHSLFHFCTTTVFAFLRHCSVDKKMEDNKYIHVYSKSKEVGWDSEKPGYNGLIEVANRLMMRRSNSETKEAAVRILRALFPPLLLELYQMLIAPLQGGKVAAIMVARVTALSCQWLMGPCAVNNVDHPDGSSLRSGVFVERCKYLEESKCVGICINTCKLPTQTFFKDYMGVPLLMEPNFSDYSCQFKFGVLPPQPEDDNALKEPCLEICPNARHRREFGGSVDVLQCPKA